MKTKTYHPGRKSLARLVAHYRARRGLTLRELAEAITAEGVPKTRGAVHHWERGGGIRRESAAALVSVFGLEGPEAMAIYKAGGFVVDMGSPNE